jgi:peptide/nickel transport system permease protein
MTLELAVFALIFATFLGIVLGILSAVRRNSATDTLTMAGANIGVSIPVFVLGLLAAFVFAILLKNTPFALPPSGRLTPGVSVVPLAVRWGMTDAQGPLRAIVDFVSNIYTVNGLLSAQWGLFVDAFRHMILPAVVLGTIPLAIIARITRSSLLDVLGHDYVRTARAKGLAEGAVIRHHALRNAMLPLVTVIGLQIGGRPHRDDLQPPRRRRSDLRCDHLARLRRDPGVRPRDRGHVPRHQPDRRHQLRIPRSEASPDVSAA